MQFVAFFCVRTFQIWQSGVPNQMENKTLSRKTKVIIFSRFPLARNSEPILKLYDKRLKISPHSKLTFQKHFEEIFACCNTRDRHLRLVVNSKWEPTSDVIISKITQLQNKFIWLVLHLPKYVSVKLLPDSSIPAF